MFIINKEMNIHKYYEDEGITQYHPLNPDLIAFVRQRGWNIIKKIAEGSVSDVFTCSRSQLTAVIIFFGSDQCEEENDRYLDIHDRMEKARLFPNIFPIIYDEFQSDIPYSTDEIYLGHSRDSRHRTIQVIEKMDMSFSDYYLTLSDQQKEHVKIELKQVLSEYFETLIEHKIYFGDLSPDNIGVIIVASVPKFKLLDIEGIWINTDKIFNAEEQINTFFEYEELFDT